MTLPLAGTNLVQLFEARAVASGERPLLHVRRDGAWQAWSWARVRREARALAATLLRLGVQPGDRVALVAENRPEWCVADLAILHAGAVTAPSYTSYATDDYAWFLNHCEPVVVVHSGPVAARLLPAVAAARSVRAVIAMDGPGHASDGSGPQALAWAQALDGAAPDGPLPGHAARPGDTACLIYTSGTGGRPKAVIATHRNVTANIEGVWGLLERYAANDRAFLSFLPLSHAYEHTAGQFLPIATDGQVWYSRGVEHLVAELGEVRPRLLLAVPRLFEVFRQRIQAQADRQGGWRARLLEKAVELGTRRHHEGRLPPHLLPLDLALDRLVRAKVRARFGGRLTAVVCGGGPLNPGHGAFLEALGIPVCHGYGQTEASPVVSVTPPGSRRLSTVGPPLAGVEVKVAGDGEILVRGDLVTPGYWRDPEATAAAIQEGWLHTGDVGRLDAGGWLTITDRKKDIIVLSGGDTIAPQRIEAALCQEAEIAQAVVHGDARPALVALLVPTRDLLAEALAPGLLEQRLGQALRRANAGLAPAERVRRFAVVEEPFTIENGLLTPTLKPRRRAITERYQDQLATLHGRG